MTCLARVVAVAMPHHVTQRGNARQYILGADADRKVSLDLLRQSIALRGLALVGYCLMSNHVHLIATPGKVDILGRALKDTHGRYAAVRPVLDRMPHFAELLSTTQDQDFGDLRLGSGRPLGTAEVVPGVERLLGRPLARRAPGRKPAISVYGEQLELLQ